MMRAFFISIFGGLISWWGLALIAALDSTLVVVIPLAVDITLIILASRSPKWFWLYPIIASVGSLFGAALTFYIGRRLGEPGLERFVSKGRLDRIRKRIEDKGAVALGVLDLLPPPFPFTACILAAGALEVSIPIFFVTLELTRLLRFGVEAVLAYFYGPQIIGWLQSATFEYIGVGLFAIAIILTTIGLVQLIRGKNELQIEERINKPIL
jgi:membrane protein YqaA with SNARE-associated domain